MVIVGGQPTQQGSVSLAVPNGMISPPFRLADHRETRFWGILTRLRAILVTGCALHPLRYLLFSIGEWCSIAVCGWRRSPCFMGQG